MASVLELLDTDTMGISKDNIHDVLSLIKGSDFSTNLMTTIVDPVDARRYKGNFFGLLKNVLGVPNSAIYMNIILNGYSSSLDYDGKLRITLLSNDVAQNIMVYLQEEKTIKANIGF